MKKYERFTLIAFLLKEMKKNGNWCGGTHVQKEILFLDLLFNVPLDLNYILYKHGPFSFGLRNDLSAMWAESLIRYIPQHYPLGPKIRIKKRSEILMRIFPETVVKYQNEIVFVTKKLKDSGVIELEGLGTALWVSKKENIGPSVSARAKRLHKIKNHISEENATKYINIVDRIIADSEALLS